MQLYEISNLPPTPEPWSEGGNIPWNEREFSRRMLDEHLSQSHDAASRRFPIIEKHVEWIHRELLGGHQARILDLGCGPGLYANRLAHLGHCCHGIDFSPASIEHAAKIAEQDGLPNTFELADIRQADYGSGFRLAMQIYGELNVFRPEDARQILCKAYQALEPEGILLLETQTFGAIQERGEGPNIWYISKGGLFLDTPHLYLEQHFWDSVRSVTTTRFLIVDVASGTVQNHILSAQAYTHPQYHELLESCGFTDIRSLASLTGTADTTQRDLIVLVARKP